MWHTNKHPGISARLLNEDLDRLQNYCDKWKLKINSSKTVYSVFTKSHIVAKKNIRLPLRGTNLKKEEIPIYLGVKLDRQLALKEHIQDLRGRANKRLQLVKRLASTSWGADKNTLRQLYNGYVRSLMEYNLALQSISSKTKKDLLDRVQSQAVHFISGGTRSTPTAACEIHTNIEPLGLRRDAAVMNMVERYKRSDKSHPNRQLIDTWKPTGRLKQKSVMDIATYLQEKHHLPNNRENLQHFCKEIHFTPQKVHSKYTNIADRRII
ncbi:reverse transcriptase-like protein [Elysia marginata]|uniref:Reverse transcriptase-like protein n=1 Tax=Elysia marginata TaxID=1093978 RepID=A0AAV4IGZ7_9GAST|nr:reverse transcriptase-like protein [Elysia marginata]